jgi:hypothetical protein
MPLNIKISETVIHSQITISDSEIRAAMRQFFRHTEDVKHEIELRKFDDKSKSEGFPKELGSVIERQLRDLHIDEHLYDHEIMGLWPIVDVHETFDDIVSYLKDSDPYKINSIMCATLIDNADIDKLIAAVNKLPNKNSPLLAASNELPPKPSVRDDDSERSVVARICI